MKVAGDPTTVYPYLRISSDALESNLNLIRGLIPAQTKVLIPVKANAYGCGLKELIPFFQKTRPDSLGVANPLEGVELRQLGWGGAILNLGGFYPDHAHLFAEHDLEAAITDLWQVSALQEAATQAAGKGIKAVNPLLQKIKAHIKLDLGMGRIGIRSSQLGELVEALLGAPQVEVCGIFTHFPKSDQPSDPSTAGMVEQFGEVAERLIDELGLERRSVTLHAANSYGVLLHPASHFDMVRPGLIFYGYFQSMEDLEALGVEFPLRPALELAARPISLRSLSGGDAVSYGSTYRVEDEESPVGVIPLGYADGIPRALSNRIEFQGHPLLGRVTMDQIVLGGVASHQEVRLLGEGSPPLERWAQLSGTISYEIMTGFGRRIFRRLV